MMAHPNVDTSHIVDALIELQMALLGVDEEYEAGDNFDWKTIRDAVERLQSIMVVAQNLSAAVHPATQRRLISLLDEISEIYHLKQGTPIVAPPPRLDFAIVEGIILCFCTGRPDFNRRSRTFIGLSVGAMV